MFLCRSCCHIPKPGRDVQLPLVDKQQAIPVNTNRRKCLLRKSTLKAARRSLSHFQLAGALTEVGRSRGRLPSNRSPKVLHPIQPRTRWIRGPSPRLGTISPRGLSRKLKMMEGQGIVQRTLIDTHPPSVRYSLTSKGATVARIGTPVFLFLSFRK